MTARDTTQQAVSDKPSRWWLPAALFVFALVFAGIFADVIREGPGRVILADIPANIEGTTYDTIRRHDAVFQCWLVARNAQTWSRAPHRMIDAPHCAPYDNSLTFGIPMLTLGILGVPVERLTGDPVLTYNSAIALMLLLAALAMFLLVREWTGSPAAGIVAGLLYAFHTTRLSGIHYPSVWDTTWTVFALWFALRLFEHGRWRDAAGLAAAITLQIWASFYPFLAAVILGIPIGVWLMRSYGFERARGIQIAVVLAATGAAAVFLLLPYAMAAKGQGLVRDGWIAFGHPRIYLPGDYHSPGWIVYGLTAVALFAGRSGLVPSAVRRDPRWILLGSAVAVALFAAGPTLQRLVEPVPFPDLYSTLGTVIPGLKTVRGVHRLAGGVNLLLCILAGIGAAAMLRRAGRRQNTLAALLIIGSVAHVLYPAALGIAPERQWKTVTARPADNAIELARTLRSAGTGPVFEVPYAGKKVARQPYEIFLSYYHGRRTSSCFGSYMPENEQMRSAALRLPNPGAVATLRAMGFDTVLLHHGPPPSQKKSLFDATAARADSGIQTLASTPAMTAYSIGKGAPLQ